jgi:carbamate kinase
MANQKAAYEIQVGKWEEELKTLKEKSEKTELHTNPAIAQVRAIASWAKMDRNLTEDNVAWGSLAVMLVMTILVNLGLALCGHAIGKQKAIGEIVFAEAEADEQRPLQRLAYHPRDDDRRTVSPEPIPLRPTPSPRHTKETQETVIVTTSTAGGGAIPMTGDPNVDEVLRRSQEANEAARRKIADMLQAMKAQGSA